MESEELKTDKRECPFEEQLVKVLKEEPEDSYPQEDLILEPMKDYQPLAAESSVKDEDGIKIEIKTEPEEQLEEPHFVPVEEEPNDGNLLDAAVAQDIFESSDNAEVCVKEPSNLETDNTEMPSSSSINSLQHSHNSVKPLSSKNTVRINNELSLARVSNPKMYSKPKIAFKKLDKKSLGISTFFIIVKAKDFNESVSRGSGKEQLATESECGDIARQRGTERGGEEPQNVERQTYPSSDTGSKQSTSNEESFSCGICGESFQFSCQLEEHKTVHTDETPFKCSVCDKLFTRKYTLVIHMRMHAGEPLLSCSVCGQAFTKSSLFDKHMITHISNRPYKCNVCKKTYLTKGHLANHMFIHRGEMPYKCSHCEKAFRLKSHIVEHIRTHTGEKPYKCDVCEKSFAQRCNLTKHVRVHTGQRPYKCSICGKGFTQSCALSTHNLIHTGERPFACKFCGKCFNTSSYLTRHTRVVHTADSSTS